MFGGEKPWLVAITPNYPRRQSICRWIILVTSVAVTGARVGRAGGLSCITICKNIVWLVMIQSGTSSQSTGELTRSIFITWVESLWGCWLGVRLYGKRLVNTCKEALLCQELLFYRLLIYGCLLICFRVRSPPWCVAWTSIGILYKADRCFVVLQLLFWVIYCSWTPSACCNR